MPRTFHFHCYWVLAQEQSKKQTSLRKERMEGLAQNEIKIKQDAFIGSQSSLKVSIA